MRLSIGKGIIIVICVLLLGGLVYRDSMSENNLSEQQTQIELSFMLGDNIINAWKGEDAYYLFLPSYATPEDVELVSWATEFEIPDMEALVMRGGSLAALPFDEVLSCRTVSSKEKFSFCIMQSANLPAVFMETDSGTLENIWTDKEVEENGKLQIVDEAGERLYRGGLKSIKGRGNYSYAHYEKKPFSITTKEEVSLLGLGTGAKYALLSNASDPTLIRNELARKMEVALETEYTNEGRFVDLYVNGDYLGNYYLCENIEIGAERINVTDLEAQMDKFYQNTNYDSFDPYETETKRAKQMNYNPADITGGYLVEREFEDRYHVEYADNPSSFITEGKEHFVVQSPRYCSDEQIDYLEQYFSEAEAALLTEDGVHPDTGFSYDAYIDVDSFTKKYLVEEVTKNYDAGVSSCFIYKDSDSVDGRIKAAPIWDCDMSFGNYLDWMEYFSEDPKGVSNLSLHAYSSPWYDALYQKEEVYEKICSYYEKKVSPYLDELVTETIDEYREYLSASAQMNDIRWQVDLNNNEYYSDRETEYEELKQFITERKDFLDGVWIEQISYYIVTFEKDGEILEIRHIKEGEAVGKLPVMTDETFNGWFYEQGRRPVKETDGIIEDTVFTCDAIE